MNTKTILTVLWTFAAALVATSAAAPSLAYTVDDCYMACSLTGAYVTPFYMNFYQPAAGPAECYCCQECTLVYALGVLAYQVDVAATRVRRARGPAGPCRPDTDRRLTSTPR